MPEQFAYGKYVKGGCYCPSYASTTIKGKGEVKVGGVFDIYDEILYNEYGDSTGVVPSEEAKEAWEQAIKEYEQENGRNQTLKNAEKVWEELWG